MDNYKSINFNNNLTYQDILNNYNLIHEYQKQMKSYSKYCKEEEKSNWEHAIDCILPLASIDPTLFKFEMIIFEDAAYTMQLFSNGYVNKEIKKLLNQKNFSSINKILNKYSIYEIKYTKFRYFEDTKDFKEKCKIKKKKLKK